MKFSQISAFTVVELAIVMAVMVVLAGAAIIVLPAWREAAAKAGCQANMINVQKAMRAWSMLNNRTIGAAVNANATAFLGNDANTSLMPRPECSSGGNYTFLTTIPAVGVRFANCSIARHPEGQSTDGW